MKYVKSKLSPKSYYLKVFKPKMIKNIPKKTTFDIGSAPLKKDKDTILKFNAISYKNGKVVIYQKYYGPMIGGNTVTTIEKYKTNKLKITVSYLTGTPGNKKVSYVSSKYLPKDYYLKVLRPKITKNLVSEMIFDEGDGYYNNEYMWTKWSATSLIDSSVRFSAISYGYKAGQGQILSPDVMIPIPGGAYVLTIEKYGNNKLKITYHNGGALAKHITFVKTNYTPKQYYLKVFKTQKSFPYYS